MAMVKVLISAVCIVSLAMGGESASGEQTAAQHHVVGGDRGWDPNSDVASWSSGRVFRVGDNIWFTYSVAQENIVELKSKEEYEACDVANPIRMFSDGLDIVPLEEEGIRYFASGKPESCNKGLKLHVDVQPTRPLEHNHQKNNNVIQSPSLGSTLALADAPTTPSSSTRLDALCIGLFAGFFISYFLP